MRHLSALIIIICLAQVSYTQQPGKSWNGYRAAVSLTYDDAVAQQLANAIPHLDSLGLRATFYLTTYTDGFMLRREDWKKAAAKGHEMGNHTLFHPCEGGRQGREWVNPDYDLTSYSVARMQDEIKMTNIALELLDGKKERTFAYPCGDTLIAGKPYLKREEFVAARSTIGGTSFVGNTDLYHIKCFSVNGQSGAELIAEVKKAKQEGSLLVFLFHGVGGGHGIDVSLQAHRELLIYLKSVEKEIWIAPMVEIARFIRMKQQAPKL